MMRRSMALAGLLGAVAVLLTTGILAAWMWPEKNISAEESSMKQGGVSQGLEESSRLEESLQQADSIPLKAEPDVAADYSGWAQAENGNWFYYRTGEKATGWIQLGTAWYLLSDSGVMQTGWKWYAGHWYYMDASGAMRTGWVNDNGKWYYMDCSGAMMKGFIHDGNGWYYLDAEGVWQENYTDAEVTSSGRMIRIENGVAYVDGILIANKKYPLPKDYAPGRLTDEVQAALAEMQQAAAADGLNLYVVSGYRSYEYQGQLYQNYVKRDGQAAADRYSARPGYSEHQTGLAFDLNSTSNSFAGTPEAKWLAAHAQEYGFIIRYPKGKENVTGYQYEPWHLRYLGKEIAQAVYDSGLCLEEYLGIASYYTNE